MGKYVCGVAAAVAWAALAGCAADDAPESGRLTGRVTAGGSPVPEVTVVAVAADGTEASGLTDSTGTYKIDAPPKGPLKFKLSGLVPPPPPGVKAPPPPPGAVTVPRRYHTTGNELGVEYAGGTQTYDLALRP